MRNRQNRYCLCLFLLFLPVTLNAGTTIYSIMEFLEEGDRKQVVGYLMLNREPDKLSAVITLQTQKGRCQITIEFCRDSDRGAETKAEALQRSEPPYQSLNMTFKKQNIQKEAAKAQSANILEQLVSCRRGHLSIPVGRRIKIIFDDKLNELNHFCNGFGVVDLQNNFTRYARSRVDFSTYLLRPSIQLNQPVKTEINFNNLEGADYEVEFANPLVDSLNGVFIIKSKRLFIKRYLSAERKWLPPQSVSSVADVIDITSMLLSIPDPDPGDLSGLKFSINEVQPDYSDHVSYAPAHTFKSSNTVGNKLSRDKLIGKPARYMMSRNSQGRTRMKQVTSTAGQDTYAGAVRAPVELSSSRDTEELPSVKTEIKSQPAYWRLDMDLPQEASRYIELMRMGDMRYEDIITGLKKLYGRNNEAAVELYEECVHGKTAEDADLFVSDGEFSEDDDSSPPQTFTVQQPILSAAESLNLQSIRKSIPTGIEPVGHLEGVNEYSGAAGFLKSWTTETGGIMYWPAGAYPPLKYVK